MSGAHRRRDGNWLPGTLKTAQSLLMLVAVIVVPSGLIALVVYLAVSGWELEIWIALWLCLLALFVDFVVRQRDRGRAEVTAGALIGMTGEIVSLFSRQRGWPAGELQAIALVGHLIELAGVVYLVVNIVTWIGSAVRWWRGRASPD